MHAELGIEHVADDEALQAWPWLAHTQHEFAVALLARGAHGDRVRATALHSALAAVQAAVGAGERPHLFEADRNAIVPGDRRQGWTIYVAMFVLFATMFPTLSEAVTGNRLTIEHLTKVGCRNGCSSLD